MNSRNTKRRATVASAVGTVGVLLTAGLVATPPAAAADVTASWSIDCSAPVAANMADFPLYIAEDDTLSVTFTLTNCFNAVSAGNSSWADENHWKLYYPDRNVWVMNKTAGAGTDRVSAWYQYESPAIETATFTLVYDGSSTSGTPTGVRAVYSRGMDAWGDPARTRGQAGLSALTPGFFDSLDIYIYGEPAAPGGLTATPGAGQVSFTWNAASGRNITNYTVTGGGGSCTATDPTVGCTISGLTGGVAASFTVTAENSVGTGPASVAVSATPTAAATPAPATGGGTTTTTTTTTEDPEPTLEEENLAAVLEEGVQMLTEDRTPVESAPGTGDYLNEDGTTTDADYVSDPDSVTTGNENDLQMQLSAGNDVPVASDGDGVDGAGIITFVRGREGVVQGSGFAPNTTTEVWINSEPRSLKTVQVGADGRFEITFQIPDAVPDGNHTISAEGLTNQGQPRAITAGVRLTSAEAVTAEQIAAKRLEPVAQSFYFASGGKNLSTAAKKRVVSLVQSKDVANGVCSVSAVKSTASGANPSWALAKQRAASTAAFLKRAGCGTVVVAKPGKTKATGKQADTVRIRLYPAGS